MIDLHCHLLPAIDDGADDLQKSLQMAEIAVADGIEHIACTPHIYPAVFENTAAGIDVAINNFRAELVRHDIPLQLSIGADVHLVPEVMAGLKDGTIPTLNNSRYFLLEPSHHVPSAWFVDAVFDFVATGYVPIITHPERLTWCEDHYEEFVQAAASGAWMQLTSGSLTGRFGSRVQKLSEQMLEDGIVHLLATDAHGTDARAPLLAEGRDAAARIVGEEEARRMVEDRPRGILNDIPVAEQSVPPGLLDRDPVTAIMNARKKRQRSWFGRLFG